MCRDKQKKNFGKKNTKKNETLERTAMRCILGVEDHALGTEMVTSSGVQSFEVGGRRRWLAAKTEREKGGGCAVRSKQRLDQNKK